MAVESATDRAAFLADFGVPATLTPSSYPHPATGKTATVTVIFDMQYVEVGNVSGYKPIITCQTSSLTDNDIGVGASVTVLGNNYTVIEIENDGTGMSVLILERQ